MPKKSKVGPPKPKVAKGNKRQRTRARLIEAAVEVIREKGYNRASLEDVARRAGMTRGAIYNNFKDKEDLLLAAAVTRWKPVAPVLKKGMSLKKIMNLVGTEAVKAVPERRANAIAALSFQIYALSNKTMRLRMVEADEACYRWAEERLLAAIPAKKLPLPPHEFVRLIHAMTDGLITLRFLTPELVTDEFIVAAFESLA
jgi:AcrR family transcriptional regulator